MSKLFDELTMFKVLKLQRPYNLYDPQVESQVKDRHSFQPFLNLGLEEGIPDEKPLWEFREQLSKAGAIRKPCSSSSNGSTSDVD